jgi:choline dehydrogenase
VNLPRSADVVVVGSGSAGAAVAGLLADRSEADVLLLEAGPDYGPRLSGRWPADLLDATMQPTAAYDPASRSWVLTASHDWGYVGEVHGRSVAFARAKVLGGCSSHNGAAIVHGSRTDYDGWAAAGNPGWSTDELAPLFAWAWEHLRVRRVGLGALTPFQEACLNAIAASGIPVAENINDFDENWGVGPYPVSADRSGVRVSCAFGYIDPVRGRPNFKVVGDAEVERLLLSGDRVAGVVVQDQAEELVVHADRVVVCGGAYGSPALLLRSGIGPAWHLREVGVEVRQELPGVGENLHDQPSFMVGFAGTAELTEAIGAYASSNWLPYEQIIAKYPSEECSEGFDMHVFPVGGPNPAPHLPFYLGGAVLRPLSRGAVRLAGPSTADGLVLDHGYLTDPGSSDLRRLVEVVERIREIACEAPLGSLLGEEILPGPEVAGRRAVTDFIADSMVHYYHPAGSCKMGPTSDPDAVVGADGAVHGIEDLFVADASIMPTVTSGNTHMPTVVIGEKIGRVVAGHTQAQAALARDP